MEVGKACPDHTAFRAANLQQSNIWVAKPKTAVFKATFNVQEREYLIEQIEKRPDASWRSNSMWTFRNDAKVYGSPMFDDAWSKAKGGHNPMPDLLQTLRDSS